MYVNNAGIDKYFLNYSTDFGSLKVLAKPRNTLIEKKKSETWLQN